MHSRAFLALGLPETALELRDGLVVQLLKLILLILLGLEIPLHLSQALGLDMIFLEAVSDLINILL